MSKYADQDDKRALFEVCPACNAQPGKPCTQPTDNSRTNVSWLHYARTTLAYDKQETTTMERDG